MPLALFPDLTWEVMENSKYHYIEQIKKMVIDRSEQEIVPVMPDEEVIAALGIDPTKPNPRKKFRAAFSRTAEIFEYSRNSFKSEDYRFTLIARRHH